MRRLIIGLAVVGTLVGAGQVLGETVFDAAADLTEISIDQGINPNGPWSYGLRNIAASSDFTLLPDAGDHINSGLKGWLDIGGSHSLPAVMKNFTGDVAFHIQPGQLLLHPGDGSGDHSEDAYAVVRWAAPVAGPFTIDATFSGVTGQKGQITTTDVHVVRNGVSLFDAVVIDNSQTYSGDIIVALGDTIDFLVGPYTNGFFDDSTVLDARLALIPEPSTLAALVSLALCGIGWRHRRKP